MNSELLEAVLENIVDGLYVLDDKGIYIFANSTYMQSINMTKAELMGYDVHGFIQDKVIEFCISDIVYREKRRVVMFQDVNDRYDPSRRLHRQLVISTPIFDNTGNVTNIVAVVRRLDTMDEFYLQASMAGSTSSYTPKREKEESAIVAESPAMLDLLATARTVADVDSPVLVTGESGTGKEVIAQYVHDAGKRGRNRLVVINCASIPATLLEAELFGYEKGAFTGAAAGKPGLFEAADGGTIFLDEINSLPLDLQGKLLRAIETKTIQRVGSTDSRMVDFRVISASNEDVQQLVDERRFRVDLYYRLHVIPLHLPPLRERQEDIIPLTMHFLRQFCQKYDKNKVFSENTLALIRQYDWPGNVRELKNFVERSVVMTMGNVIEMPHIKGVVATVESRGPAFTDVSLNNYGINYMKMLDDGVTLDDFLAACESAYVTHVLANSKSTYHAAKTLGTSQSSVMRRKKKFGI